MKLTSLYICFLFSLALSIDISYIENDEDWQQLQNKEIKIYHKIINDQPYCKASKIFNFNSYEIKSILDDKKNYPKNFKRIMFCDSINKDVVHIGVKLPFPFNPRDYVVEYKYFKNDGKEYYIYSSVQKSTIKNTSRFIRLPNASGIWLMEQVSKDKTKLTYLWQGELLGNFPSWVLQRVWKEQGNELLTQLEIALENN
tara:strand:- start:1026 stop:1622 length:597 start_codon:yes stop_codon:yes gene_type:complete